MRLLTTLLLAVACLLGNVAAADLAIEVRIWKSDTPKFFPPTFVRTNTLSAYKTPDSKTTVECRNNKPSGARQIVQVFGENNQAYDTGTVIVVTPQLYQRGIKLKYLVDLSWVVGDPKADLFPNIAVEKSEGTQMIPAGETLLIGTGTNVIALTPTQP